MSSELQCSPIDQKFSFREVLTALRSLGVECMVDGAQLTSRVRFTSLRAPRSGGLYYCAGGAGLPSGVDSSIVLSDRSLNIVDGVTLIVDQPQVTYYRLMAHLLPVNDEPTGIHPTAIVHPKASVAKSAYIGPYSIVGNSIIEDGARLASHVHVFDGVIIGSRSRVEPHSTLGATGVAWAIDRVTGEKVRQPQYGGVKIGAGVFIGSDVTIVRGSVNELTSVGDGALIAHGSKIGHGCRIGREAHLANNVSVAGNVDVGACCFLGSGSVVRPQITIAADIVVGAGAVVVRDELESGVLLMGVPAKSIRPEGTLSGVPRRRDDSDTDKRGNKV